MSFSVALTSDIHTDALRHLLRSDGQEDLCFALWNPSHGAERKSALVGELLLPLEPDREVHGNAEFMPQYFARVLDLAVKKRMGIAFMHSHLGPGWQNMSLADVQAENRIAASVKGATGLPLVGMTLGTDGAWSGRFWEKTGPGKYERQWCRTVRVVGENGLQITFADHLCPPPKFRERLRRTISAWGEKNQAKLARTTFAVVGLGSVGSIVAESLARMGIVNVKLIDFDLVEEKNLDRLLNCGEADIGEMKVKRIAQALRRDATAENFRVDEIPYSIVEEDGFRNALDCDVIFSCVDRPWPRSVLNLIAYAHLIPVVDGGILIQTNKDGSLRGADWKAHVVGPHRRCLECLGQFDPANVQLEREGQLDNPVYIKTLSEDNSLRKNENVFSFSLNLASLQVLQMLSMVIAPLGLSNVGEHLYHFTTGRMDVETRKGCSDSCIYQKVISMGDRCPYPVTGPHERARTIRDAYHGRRKDSREAGKFLGKVGSAFRKPFKWRRS